MIPQALLVVFCIAETLSVSTMGRHFDIQRSSRALATSTNRFELGQQRVGMAPMGCLTKCNHSPACRAINAFTNGTCEVLLSPVIGVNFSAESTTYISFHKTCPNGFGDALVSSAAHGSCYKIVRDRMTWQGARALCVSLGGDLVAIEDEAELKHLGKVTGHGDNGKGILYVFWSSGTDEDVEGEWRWASTGARVDGSLPSEYRVKSGNTQNCLHIYFLYNRFRPYSSFLYNRFRPYSSWGDCDCTWLAYPLCELALG